MTDRSLWLKWKLVARLMFTPEPEFTDAQLLCGPCGAGYAAQHPRTKTLCLPVGMGDIEKQLRELEREQTELLRQSGYTLAAWQQDSKASPPCARQRSDANKGEIERGWAQVPRLTNPFIQLNDELKRLELALQQMEVDPDRAAQVCAHFLVHSESRVSHRSTEANDENPAAVLPPPTPDRQLSAFSELARSPEELPQPVLAAAKKPALLAWPEKTQIRPLPAGNPAAPAKSFTKDQRAPVGSSSLITHHSSLKK